jgi:hypothetical protein
VSHRRTIAAVSGIYDALAAVGMLAGRPLLAQLLSVPPPTPPLYADIIGLFLLSVAAGYLIPYREPDSRAGRSYLWVMGPMLKGGAALVFVLDYWTRQSSPGVLWFAAGDGALALATLWALRA